MVARSVGLVVWAIWLTVWAASVAACLATSTAWVTVSEAWLAALVAVTQASESQLQKSFHQLSQGQWPSGSKAPTGSPLPYRYRFRVTGEMGDPAMVSAVVKVPVAGS